MATIRGVVGAARKGLAVAAGAGLKVVYTDTPQSRAIARIGYSVTTSELRIVFRDKAGYPEYIWGGIDIEFATQFMYFANSKGQFYHKNLRGRGEYRITKAIGSWRLGAIGRRITRKVGSTR